MQLTVGLAERRLFSDARVGGAGGGKGCDVRVAVFPHERLVGQQSAMGGVREGIAHAQQVAVRGRQVLWVARKDESSDGGQSRDDHLTASEEPAGLLLSPPTVMARI